MISPISKEDVLAAYFQFEPERQIENNDDLELLNRDFREFSDIFTNRDSHYYAPEFDEFLYIDIENDVKSTRRKFEAKQEVKQKDALHKALHDKEKEMLSFFTHTMRNALATAPESLRQAIQLLGSEVYEKDTKHYQAINKIASLFSTLSLTDCLIDIH
jgi:hypothetical protein